MKDMADSFRWDDPFLLDAELAEEERLIRDTAQGYAQDRLALRVREAFRNERTDPAIFARWAFWASPSPRNTAAPARATCPAT